MKIQNTLLTAILLFFSCLNAEAVTVCNTNDTLHLEEVVVTGTRQATDVRHLPQTLTIVTREQLTENHRSNVLPTLMEQVPGMMVTSRGMMGYGVSTGGSGGMMLRGISSSAGQLMVLIDGHPQYNGVYGHSIADSYQTLMADRIEVLRGPASMLYGSNAMGGVVNIVTRQPHEDGCHTGVQLGAGSWGSVEGEAFNQYRHGRFSSTVAGQYGRSDNHRPNMGFEQYGGYAKLGFDLSKHWNLYGDMDMTHFNASYPGTVTTPMLEADQWITRGAVSVGVENHYERTSGRIGFYDNFGRHKIDDGYNANTGKSKTMFFRSRDALMGVSLFQRVDAWKGSHITVGFDYQNIYGHAWYTDKATGETVANATPKSSDEVRNHELAAYVDLRQDILSLLTLDAGIRYDHHSVTGGEWVPQIGLVVRPIETGELKASVSKGFRNPTMKDLYLYPASTTDLLPERLISYELAWRQRLLDGRLTYAASIFYIDADNIIQTVNKKNVNTGELKNSGFECEVAYRLNTHWALNTNHSYLHMKQPVISAPRYKGYLGASMRYGRWTASAGLMQICGLYTTPINDKSSLADESTSTEHATLLNASVGYQPLSWLRLWVKGDNLLAQRYEFVQGMPMPRATFMGGFNIDI